MNETLQVPYRKLYLTVFIILCFLLMVFYYDNTLLGFALLRYPTEEIAWDVQNDSINVWNSSKADNIPVSSFSFISTIATATSTNYNNTIFVFNSSSTVSTLGVHTVSKAPVTTAINRHATSISDENYEYIVSSSKCKMPNFHPFNKDAKRYYHRNKYKPCRSKELLSYVTVIDNTATLYVDTERVPSYSSHGVSCCYSNVTRVDYKKNPDSKIKLSTCKYFDNNITVYRHPISVKCVDSKSRRQLYENVHSPILIDDNVQKKINNFDNTTNPFSVLFIGIDSISRLNFIRSLTNTYNFVEKNGWIPLKGYNKMDDNTFPNLMAILTGYNQSRAYSVCNPKVVGKLDKCPILWYNFRNLGYITGYAEDAGNINTFNYNKRGFASPPADYYYRPYILASERLTKVEKDGMVYCTGPETAGERIMNLAKDFSIAFKNYSNFGFFWMNSFSHNDINSPSRMDDKVKDFLEKITNEGVTNNTIIIFLSDHGVRFGDIRRTDTGWLEERLPFIYVSFPEWFKTGFQREYNNFKINTYRLTSPYDLHMTLQHILVLSGRNHNVTASEACPTCRSLFEEAEPERSCAEAGITQHWCTCEGYTNTSLSSEVNNKLGNFMLDTIHNIIRSRNSDHRCAKYSIEKILGTRISKKLFSDNENYIIFQFQTKPNAVFESTIKFSDDINKANFSITGDISRLDKYNAYSKCVSDAYLRKYCYCRSTGEKI